MQQQKKNAESSNKHFARRNLNMNRGKPYIEYTRNQDEDFLPLPPGQHPAAAAAVALAQGQVQKRAVARKSTTAKRSNDLRTTKPDPNRLVLPGVNILARYGARSPYAMGGYNFSSLGPTGAEI